MDIKKCTRCGIEKPINEFTKDNSKKFGIRAACKSCEWERLEYSKSYRKANKKYFEDYWSNYYKHGKYRRRNNEYYADYMQKRRAKMKSLPCDFNNDQWEEIKKSQEYKCVMCGEIKPLHRDHIIPVKKGGGYTKNNIQGLCKTCNSKKGSKILNLNVG